MKKQFNPFPDMSCAYGAPMGRCSDNPANLHGRGDGYDKGGAYWGTPSNVWGVWDDDRNVVYVRASSRADAIVKAKA